MDRSDLTPKQQASEAIRQAETILILTGQNPSVDQVVSVMALAALLRKLNKKVTGLISDQLPKSISFLGNHEIERSLSGLRDFIVKVNLNRAEVDKLKYTIEGGNLNIHVTPFRGGFGPEDVSFDYGNYHYDLCLVLGVPSRSRIDRIYAQNPQLSQIPIVNIDFHRINENFGAINLIDPAAASLSEILIALSESLQTGLIDAQIATMMLTGLMASTDRFTANHTTPKALTVAAQMMAAGANQQEVVKGLYRYGGERPAERTRSQRPEPKLQVPQPTPQPPVTEPVNPEPVPEPTVPTPQPTPPIPGPVPDPIPEPPAPEKPAPGPVAAPNPMTSPLGGPPIGQTEPSSAEVKPAKPMDPDAASSSDDKYSSQLNTYQA